MPPSKVKKVRQASGLDIFERQLPQTPDAERIVLSAIFKNPALFRLVDPVLSAGDFGYDFHRHIFMAMWSLNSDGLGIDVLSVSTWLQNEGILPQSEEKAIVSISPEVQAIAEVLNDDEIDVLAFAKRVKSWSSRRLAIKKIRIAVEGFYENDSPDDVIADLVKSLLKLDTGSDDELVHLSSPLEEVAKKLLEPKETQVTRVLDTGFPQLDDLLGGVSEGTVTAIVARPKCGKSTLAMQFVMHAAMTTEMASIVFLLEMDNELLSRRLIQQATGEQIKLYMTGKYPMGSQRQDFIMQAISHLKQRKIYVVDKNCNSIEQMRAYIYRWKASHPDTRLGWVVIDHWNLMKGSEETSEQRINAYEVGNLAKELSTRILIPAQCKKPLPGKYENFPPTMNDVNGSQALSEIVTNLLILHRPKKGTGETGAPDQCKIIFEAGRESGDGGSVQVRYLVSHTKFEEVRTPFERQMNVYEPAELN